MKATAVARANIALVKYWGKRDEALFLPFNASISMTAARFSTRTTLAVDPTAARDVFVLDGIPRPEDSREYRDTVGRFLGIVRERAGSKDRVRIESRNDFPTAAGLASSASAYAALAAAANEVFALGLDARGLSLLARMGSGSACRSVFGGFAEWVRGERPDGEDSHAVPLAGPDHWPEFRMLVCLTDPGEKKVKSRDGMSSTTATSPLYPGWLESVGADLAAVREGIAEKDFARIGRAAEANCLKMHATMLAARPPLLYWNPATVRIMRAVASWREEGLPCWFTIDAGPQVKILCLSGEAGSLRGRLERLPDPPEVLDTGPGDGVALTDAHLF